MNSQTALKLATAGVLLYTLIAVMCFANHDIWHMRLFLLGSVIWVVAIAVWSNV